MKHYFATCYTFNSQLAQDIGLEAAALFDVLSRMVWFSAGHERPENSAEVSLTRHDEDWLALVPFLSPGQFIAALEVLTDSGLVSGTRTHAGGRDIVVAMDAEKKTRSEKRRSAGQTATQPTLSSLPGQMDDMPPPAPETQMLTDNQDRVKSTGQRPRYSDQPLYIQNQERTKDTSDRKPSATEESGETHQGAALSHMTLDWQPSGDCMRMVKGKGIDAAFALAQRESFVLYYRDSGQRNMSWDTKFLNWVSRRWQYHLNDRQNDSKNTENNQAAGQDRRQRLRSRLRNIGDFDW